MLWYKGWLETRWRVLFPFGAIVFLLFQVHSHAGLQLRNPGVVGALALLWIFTPVLLAGSGIRPEAPFRAVMGIQGSMYFTLSLPVSRLRLLAVRAGVALLEMAGFVAVACCLAAAVLPEIRAQVTTIDGLMYAMTAFVCSLVAFGVSTLLATFLDQQWQTMLSVLLVLGGRWLFVMGGAHLLPFDFYLAMGAASPLVTHTFPFTAMCVSLGITVACFIAAIRIEQVREY